MDALKENLDDMDIGSSVESFTKFLDSQKELFHGQIDQLQRIVITQCKLTGVNPLSQEMAAGSMSIKIGKRPRDLLNPKAIKHMQAIFSMKDAITKKESREISAQFGVTVTQVRDFFACQRSRVRRLVRLSREKAARVNARKEPQDCSTASSDPLIPIDIAPLSSVHPDPVSLNPVGSNSVPLNTIGSNSLPLSSIGPDQASVNSDGPSSVEEAPSCSTQDDILSGLPDMDQHFVENIFSLLRKEETFSGQVKLMEWILQIQNPSVLNWFLTKGGIMIMATWLSQAAAEEQSSVLHVTLKVLCHLPLHKAFPEHMSAILHSVNRLRFYRTSDISNRARVLLSRWSKLFARSQAMKKRNGLKSSIDAQDMILKQSLDEIMGNSLWRANGDNLENILGLAESSESTRKIEPSQTLKLLPASADDANKKHILGASSSHTRERRKVQYVEQPGQKTAGRSPQSSKVAPVSQGRPMSTDDIQKAKMRALFMQSKYGKTGSSANGSNGMKSESLNKPSSNPSSNLFLASKVPIRPVIEEQKKPTVVPPKILNKHESPPVPKHNIGIKEDLGELCRRVQIPWHIAPEIKIDDLWRVGTGENSKEVDVQRNRNRREFETMYRTVQEIPSNPKEPWDIEMDYDDTLTPNVPIEQPPDTDGPEAQVSQNGDTVNTLVASAPILPASAAGSAEPDLELLAVLLKNPDLVFALTSGQAGNLSPEETVKLLDAIKSSGAGLANTLNGFPAKAEENVEVSLPSPTPSSNPGTSGWRSEVVKNPFSQLNSRTNQVAYTDPSVFATTTAERHTGLLQSHNEANTSRIPPQQASLQLVSQQMQPLSLPQASSSSILHENRQPPLITPMHQNLQTPSSERGLPIHNFSTTTVRPSMRVETMNNVKAAPAVGFEMNSSERRQISHSMPASMPMSTPSGSYPQTTYVPESRQSAGNMGATPEAWRARQGLASNSLSQVNQNNYNAPSLGGQGKPSWERNEYMGEGFESWSPENSPVRSPEYMAGRNYPGARSNGAWNYSPDSRSRQRNYAANRDHNWNGNRRWR